MKVPEGGDARMKLMEQERDLRLELPKVAYRQFEVRGYDKMIERILEAPLRSSQNSNNKELESKLLLIRDQLQEQVKNNDQYISESTTQETPSPEKAKKKRGLEADEEEKMIDADEYETSSYESYYDEEVDDKIEKPAAVEGFIEQQTEQAESELGVEQQ